MGATIIGTLVAVFVLTGLYVLSNIYGTYLRLFFQSLFLLQAIAGYTCLFLFRNTDPGYLPVNDGEIDEWTAEQLKRPEYTQTSLILTRPFEPRYTAEELEQQRLKQLAKEAAGDYNEDLTGQLLEQEWCRTCRVWRPPRAAHCYVCQQCVLRNDHHCGLLGNCVGIRNHRFFIGFIFLVGTGAVTLTIATIIRLIQLIQYDGFMTVETWFTIFLLAPFGLGSCTTFIAYFHVWMLMMDVTMRERYGRKRSQYESSTMKTKEKIVEIWREIFLAPWQWKRGSVALRQKQEARKRQSNHAAINTNDASTPAMVSIAIANGEEQVGCTGVEASQFETGKSK